jgi:hypothetical protein
MYIYVVLCIFIRDRPTESAAAPENRAPEGVTDQNCSDPAPDMI